MFKILRNFVGIESISGIILIIAVIAALFLANSPQQIFYQHFFNSLFSIPFINLPISTNILLIINDGLMTLFFLLVSLEIKRELLTGELNSWSKALLPVIAAAGGILCPILLFFLCNHAHKIYYSGWAIPTATDIAFSLGILSLLGSRIPPALKSFLLALAILDDLSAIIIIAIFYTQQIHAIYLIGAFVLILLLMMFHYFACYRLWCYGMLGTALWLCLLQAGIHPTIAGVITGFCIPLPLLKKLEHHLHPWVAYGILPLFALANSGLTFTNMSVNTLLHPLVTGIMAGLFIGKPLGVCTTTWLAIKFKIAQLPQHTSWRQLFGVACLCGIGFTMSLFIGMLALGEQNSSLWSFIQLGIFISSVLAGSLGYVVLLTAPVRQAGY